MKKSHAFWKFSFKHTIYNVDYPFIQLWTSETTTKKQITTWKEFKELPDAYFDEENDLFLTIKLLPCPTPPPSSLSPLPPSSGDYVAKYLTKTFDIIKSASIIESNTIEDFVKAGIKDHHLPYTKSFL